MIAHNTKESDNATADEPVSTCSGCPQEHACRDVWKQPRKGSFSPAGLSLGSVVAFLFPWLCAIGAMVLARRWIDDDKTVAGIEIAAAAVGLVVGVAIAYFLVPVIRKRFANKSQDGK